MYYGTETNGCIKFWGQGHDEITCWNHHCTSRSIQYLTSRVKLDFLVTNIERHRVATNLEYSGISLNKENSGNSVQPRGKL